MKKHIPLAAGAALVISGLLLHFSGVATAGPQGATGGGNPFCGTFYSEYVFDGVPITAITHFNADGTEVVADMFQFGLGGTVPKGTASLGTWWHSGPREVTDVRLRYWFTPDGIPVMVQRDSAIVTFDPSFETATGIASWRTYDLSMGEDPLDPDQGTYGGELPFTLRRLTP